MKKAGLITFMILMLFFAALSIVANENITYNVNIRPILLQNGCINCHFFQSSYETLLSKVSEQQITQNILIVNPSKPDSSVIIWRIEGELPYGTPIERMPDGGDRLPQETIDLLRTWIEQGAYKDILVEVGKIHTWSKIKKKYNKI